MMTKEVAPAETKKYKITYDFGGHLIASVSTTFEGNPKKVNDFAYRYAREHRINFWKIYIREQV